MKITKNAKSYLNDESGSTAVEFGLIAIAFITLLFGIIETGRFFLSWNGFQYAVERAARTAIVDTDLTAEEIEILVTGQLGTFLMSSANASLTVTFPSSNGLDFVDIEGTYDYDIIVPFLPSTWDSFDLTAKARLVRP